ncbi:PP2C family protein-serine/threonine phosphatase [Nocardioides acrostichi]|uniref:Serine/threonine-protein phosphatase n=1 Tax=Nocardioides acrostichi TaxID=2784339 RepID=A0A930Y5W1_9ACTN|nr:PP2C family protein-serine/threonine phosphatase [Nocardioides acrostichi]MBF4160297.1 serine/threonine-protein phosphatase [Nocardioides acrostichi]
MSDSSRGPLRAWDRMLSGDLRTPRLIGLLMTLSALIVALVAAFPGYTPFTSLMVPLLIGSMLLYPRQLPWFVSWILGMILISLLLQDQITVRVAGAAGVQMLMCAIVLATAFRRSRLGVGGMTGESMFVDLRDRLLSQGSIPELRRPWHCESALRSASGTLFAGDFVVATLLEDGHRLEVVLVDVSGKGDDAGTRALQLSGAFGGLLGASDSGDFLRAANAYLLRQEWDEGFATAIHLSVDLVSGRFEVRTAGHPPGARRAAGSGRWELLRSSGPVLGLMADAEYLAVGGELRPGDALLLYTDGMIERPRRDIELGLDRMLGEAESLMRGRFEGSARRLVEELGNRQDDRAMVVLTRT